MTFHNTERLLSDKFPSALMVSARILKEASRALYTEILQVDAGLMATAILEAKRKIPLSPVTLQTTNSPASTAALQSGVMISLSD
jgi:hypothetical protein